MRLSIGLAIGCFVLAMTLGMVAGFSIYVCLLVAALLAGVGFWFGHVKGKPRQHHGHTKSSVLRNAHASINHLETLNLQAFQKSLAELRYDQGLAKSNKPAGIEQELASTRDLRLEDTKVLTDGGEAPIPDDDTPSGILYDSDFPATTRFYLLDVTITPTDKDTGGHTHFEPDGIELVVAPEPGRFPILSDSPAALICGVEYFNGSRFVPTEEKLEGKQRLRFHIAVVNPKARKLRFSYYFEQFGYLDV